MSAAELGVLFNVAGAIAMGATGHWLAACCHLAVVFALIIWEARYGR